jgi:hypothetical protein
MFKKGASDPYRPIHWTTDRSAAISLGRGKPAPVLFAAHWISSILT